MSGLEGLDWIAADWGTTRLRVWAMGARGAVLARGESGAGAGGLASGGFEPALLALVGDWLGGAGSGGRPAVPVVACGMVGSRQGWIEAPYVAVPCAAAASAVTVRPPVADRRIAVHVTRGLMQLSPADVMRGEETQIAGFLALRPDFDGVLCLPGTHTKWVRISAGEVVSFLTFMTGEMFALLSGHSVLRHGLAGGDWDDAAFEAAVDDSLSRPERLAAQLFRIRAEGILHGLAPAAARARLSGLLIGAELAAARPYWLGQTVAIVGAAQLSAAYRQALARQGIAAETADADAATLAGLAAARAALSGVPA